MSTRPNPLRDAMQATQHAAMPARQPLTMEAAPAPALRQAPPAPSRIGKRAVTAHFEPTVSRQLRILAAETDRTVQDLVGEALNDLFRKYNKSAIA